MRSIWCMIAETANLTTARNVVKQAEGSVEVQFHLVDANTQHGRVVTEPRAVATGCYLQPAIDNFAGRKTRRTGECLDPVATARGSEHFFGNARDAFRTDCALHCCRGIGGILISRRLECRLQLGSLTLDKSPDKVGNLNCHQTGDRAEDRNADDTVCHQKSVGT